MNLTIVQSVTFTFVFIFCSECYNHILIRWAREWIFFVNTPKFESAFMYFSLIYVLINIPLHYLSWKKINALGNLSDFNLSLKRKMFNFCLIYLGVHFIIIFANNFLLLYSKNCRIVNFCLWMFGLFFWRHTDLNFWKIYLLSETDFLKFKNSIL